MEPLLHLRYCARGVTVISPLFVVGAWFMASPILASAQGPIRISERQCRSCEFSLRQRVRLGTAEEPGAFVLEPTSVSVDRSGRYYVTEFGNRSEILVFGRDGAPHGKIGRSGQGPGEFRGLAGALIVNDTVVAFDAGNARITIYHAGRVIRTLSFPPRQIFQAALVSPETVIVAAIWPTREKFGLPLHALNLRDGIGAAFGEKAPVIGPGPPILHMRAIAPASGGRVWAAKRTAYEISQLDPRSDRVLEMTRDLRWFRPYRERPLGTGDPPAPWLMAIREISPRFLVTLITVAADDFSRKLGPKTLQHGTLSYDYSRMKLLFDTVIEVIDVDRRSVVFSKRIDDYLIGFIPDTQQLYGFDTVDGVPMVYVYDFTFQEGE